VSELVEVERRDHILVVSIRREAKRNAINREVADGIEEGLATLDDDPDLWVGILTGTASVFSAGSDLASRGDYVTERGGEYGVIRRVRRKPLIAAVEGPALGGGLEVVLACDLVAASTSARFGLPEVSIGALPTCAGLFRTHRTVPVNLARELILTGDPIDAARAYSAGLVNVLTEPGEALSAAMRMAERICRNAPLSVQASLFAVNTLLAATDADGWTKTREAQESLAGTHDLEEGIRAFLEKRPPVWTGR
jgi:enoyl-CoA hydratase